MAALSSVAALSGSRLAPSSRRSSSASRAAARATPVRATAAAAVDGRDSTGLSSLRFGKPSAQEMETLMQEWRRWEMLWTLGPRRLAPSPRSQPASALRRRRSRPRPPCHQAYPPPARPHALRSRECNHQYAGESFAAPALPAEVKKGGFMITTNRKKVGGARCALWPTPARHTGQQRPSTAP